MVAYLYIALSSIGIIVYFQLPYHLQLSTYDIFGFSAVIAIWTGMLMNRPATRLPWIVISVGLLFSITGDLILNNFVQILRARTRIPQCFRRFFTVGQLIIISGIGLILRRRLANQDRGTFIDAMMIATAVGVLSWIFLMVPYASDPSLTTLQKVVSIAYPVEDVLMIAMMARLLLGGGMRAPSFWFLSIALFAGTAADIVFSELTLRNGVAPDRGHWVDVGWLLWYVMFGATALHPSMRMLTETGPTSPPALTGRRLAMLTFFACLVPAAGLIESLRHNQASGAVIALGSGALFLLVLWRLRDLVEAVQQARDHLGAALTRERALRQGPPRS